MMSAAESPPVSSPAEVAIFTVVLTQGPIARVEVARRLSLSPAAVTKAVRPLMDAGYVAEVPDERMDVSAGRPANLLRVVPDRHHFLGIKVTATELIGVLTDLRAQIQATHHIPLNETEPAVVIDAIVAAAEELGKGRHIAAMGISVSGDVDSSEGVVRHSPLLGWRDTPLSALVHQRTGLPVVVENDVRALTVTEHWFGAGVGTQSFALVTIGAGIGCGLYIHGEVVTGAFGVSGEIGHLPLSQDSQICTCGRRGCVEAMASSAAILRQVRKATGDPELTMSAAIDLAHRGDRAVGKIFDRAGRLIGLALSTVANLVGPERIVISGEGVADYDLYDHRIREAFAAHAFGAAAKCELIVRPLSFEEWARGASAAAIRMFINRKVKS